MQKQANIHLADAKNFYDALTWAQTHATIGDDNEGIKQYGPALEELRSHFLELHLSFLQQRERQILNKTLNDDSRKN